MNRLGQQSTWRRGLDLVGHDSGRIRRREGRRPFWGSRVEPLEDRRLLSTLDITGGALTYDAVNAPSNLTISIATGGAEVFTDADQTITLGAGALAAGWLGSGTNTVFGMSTSISSIAVGGTNAGQSLTLDYSHGDPLRASGLTFTPAAASSGSNVLTLTSATGGTTFTSETYTATGAGAGTITYSDSAHSNVPITFSNLSPMTDTVPSPTYIFNAPAGATTVNIVNGPVVGGVQTTQINDGGTGKFELTNFANKAAVTANVNNSGATTTVDVTTAAAGLTGLFVDSGAGTETIKVQATPSGVTTTTDTGSVSGSTTTVGLNHLLTSIKGPLVVQSTGGTNTLTVDDAAEAAPTSYTLAGSVITATSFPTTITFSGGGFATLNLDSSGNSTVNLTGPAQSGVSTYNLTGGLSLGANTLNVNSNVATLTYATAGTLEFGSGQPTINYTNFPTINVTKPATAPVGTATTITGKAGQTLNDVVVATFTEGDLANKGANFVASIAWGDGTTSAGTITPVGTLGYQVTGSHTYAASGHYTVNVTLTDQNTSGTTTVGGTTINVTSNGPVASTPSPIASTASVAAAPLTALGATVRGIEGNPLVNPATGTGPVLVATFMDTGTPGSAASYTATIDWGDGSTSPTSQVTITSQGTANGTVYSVFGGHTYAETGTYALNVTITNSASGAVAIASGQAVIADAALTPSAAQPTVSTTEDTAFATTVGSFTDGNPNATPTDYTYVTIDWGDGTPATAGTISQPGGTGTAFLVSGSHNYADAGVNGGTGHYPITTDVHDVDGSTITIMNTANVADVALVVTGKLNPASDSGASNTDNITNVVQPNFIGTTNQPNATISLFATASGSSVPVSIGIGTSDATGAWSITANRALANGAYAITAVAVDSSGHTTSSTTTIVPDLVIDTAGPKVTSLSFNRFHGQIVATFQDYGGLNNGGVGLNQPSVIDANNYQLVTVHHPRVGRYRVNGISDTPGTTTGTQTVTLSINGGKYIRGGWYFFTIYSASPANTSGIRDIAGNALDGEFYGYFPSGNNIPGGNFAAQLTAIHHTIYAPSTVIGRGTPVSPPGTRQGNATVPGTFNPRMSSHFTGSLRRSEAARRDARLVRHSEAVQRAASVVHHREVARQDARLVHQSRVAMSHLLRQFGVPMVATPSSNGSSAVGVLNSVDRALDQFGARDKHRRP